MRIPDELYTTLGCALWLNLTTLYRFWPRRAQMQASAVSNHRDTVWTWKDTIWLIIILISTGLICALPFIFLTNSHTTIGTFLYCIIAIPVVVQFVSRVLPSAELIKRIVVGNGNENLKLLERLAVIVLSILVLILHGLHADISWSILAGANMFFPAACIVPSANPAFTRELSGWIARPTRSCC